MAYILNIETATTNCSVSISENNQTLHTIEINDGFTHAENLHTFIQNTFSECSLKMKQLNAVAVSCGPGSYTGLRIGVSAAKGICYALKIPLIAINTLQVLSAGVKEKLNISDALLCPMLDARRMEVYTALYNMALIEQRPTEAMIVDEETPTHFHFKKPIVFFGDGMPKCQQILNTIEQVQFIPDIIPSSNNMSTLAYDKFKNNSFEDVAYFEPFYLKDFFILKK